MENLSKQKYKKKWYSQNNVSPKKHQNISKRKSSKHNEIDMTEKCSCNKKGWCVFADRKCSPYSLKCKYNKDVFKNNTFYYQTETTNKTNTSTKRSSYNLYENERHGSNKVITNLSDNSVTELYVFNGFL